MLDNPALAQIVYFCSHALEPAVAIDDQEPFRRQEAEDWIAEAIIVGGDGWRCGHTRTWRLARLGSRTDARAFAAGGQPRGGVSESWCGVAGGR